jgi:hypothetical protein
VGPLDDTKYVPPIRNFIPHLSHNILVDSHYISPDSVLRFSYGLMENYKLSPTWSEAEYFKPALQ